VTSMAGMSTGVSSMISMIGTIGVIV
jgi:hypothetical protein